MKRIFLTVLVLAIGAVLFLWMTDADQRSAAGRDVWLFYYDPVRDSDASGNVQCTKQGLISVDRRIPASSTPIDDTIRLLLRGELTDAERARGITTEFPLEDVRLTGSSLADGVLTLSFADPLNRTGGGSCRVTVLWAQIEATALQFGEVREVRFTPDELFQP